jgi:hypothetical protein
MQTHSVRVPNLFASTKAAAAVRNRKRKRGAATPAAAAAVMADAEQMVPDDPSNWTFRTMESQVQDVPAGGIKKNWRRKPGVRPESFSRAVRAQGAAPGTGAHQFGQGV